MEDEIRLEGIADGLAGVILHIFKAGDIPKDGPCLFRLSAQGNQTQGQLMGMAGGMQHPEESAADETGGSRDGDGLSLQPFKGQGHAGDGFHFFDIQRMQGIHASSSVLR